LFTSLTAAFIFAPYIFIPGVYCTKNRRQKMEWIYGAGFWSVCHRCYGPSWVVVVGY